MDPLARAGQGLAGIDEAALHRIDAVGVGEESTEGLARHVLMTTLDLLPCEHALLLVRADDDVRLYTTLDDGVLIGMPLAEEGTLLSEAAKGSEPIVIEDVSTRADAGPVLARMFRARYLAIVPLHLNGEVVGALAALDPATASLAGEDHRILATLAQRAATGIARLRAASRPVLDGPVDGSPEGNGAAAASESELMSIVGHEIKGPLSNIVGFAQLLRTDWTGIPDEKRDHFLDIVIGEARRAARLVEDVLDVAHLEGGSMACDLEPVLLHEVITEVLSATEAMRSSHVVEVALDPNLPAVSADRDRLGQVLRNLLSNGCRYAPQGTRIDIRALRLRVDDQDCILVSVTDEGPGIPDFEQGELFDRFKRLSTSHGAEKGSGLGLYISRAIVQAHGGRIWVKSQPGEGTTFYFTLHPA